MLHSLINLEYGAFVKHRGTFYNVFMIQQIMYDLQRAPIRCNYIALKLDMEQAYDRVR